MLRLAEKYPPVSKPVPAFLRGDGQAWNHPLCIRTESEVLVMYPLRHKVSTEKLLVKMPWQVNVSRWEPVDQGM